MPRFDDYVEQALYHPGKGFYATGGRAGRRGDFLTSPEVGPLFGAVLARALDSWWHELDRPDPFTVVDAGAGPGTLARTFLAAEPECAGALRYVAVERSAAQRSRHPDGVESRADLPDSPVTGVVVANELLDNLPFRLVERTTDGWGEVWVDAGAEVLVALDDLPPVLGGLEAAPGSRVPVQEQAAAWLGAALGLLDRGRVVVIDYADTTASMASRSPDEWLRTYCGHERGGPPLDAPGTQDITVEVAVDQLADAAGRPPDVDRSQAEFLAVHGIGELVAEGKRIWAERAHLGDLAAIRARSRVSEAAALTDPNGLGAFRVLQWAVPTATGDISMPS